MSQRTLFTLIALAFVFWGIKSLKSVGMLGPRSAANLQQIDWRNADLRPYQRGDLENDPDESAFAQKQRSFKLAKAGTFSGNEIGAAKKPLNPAIAKAATKDKKKKKKKKKKALAKSLPGSPFGRQPTQKTSDKTETAVAVFNPPPSAMPAPPPAPENDEEKSFEEWAKRLLTRPNQELTDEFIRQFQSNLVTPNVFYAVLDLMFQEKDPRFRALAVRAAGAFTSVQSYDFLLAVVAKESSGSIVTEAQKALYDYSAPIALNVLQFILTSRASDETALSYALASLENSTAKFLNRAETDNAATQRHYRSMYSGFITPLRNIISQHENNNLGAIARRTLERIQQSSQTVAGIDDPAVVAGN